LVKVKRIIQKLFICKNINPSRVHKVKYEKYFLFDLMENMLLKTKIFLNYYWLEIIFLVFLKLSRKLIKKSEFRKPFWIIFFVLVLIGLRESLGLQEMRFSWRDFLEDFHIFHLFLVGDFALKILDIFIVNYKGKLRTILNTCFILNWRFGKVEIHPIFYTINRVNKFILFLWIWILIFSESR
jgi:hypothetical protein